MAKFSFIDQDNLGGPFNAFPMHQPNWSEWNDLRVEVADNPMRDYEFQVDLSVSARWAVFQGNTAPTDYNQAVAQKSFLTADDIDISFVAKTNSVR